jgi:hypothetical protein
MIATRGVPVPQLLVEPDSEAPPKGRQAVESPAHPLAKVL